MRAEHVDLDRARMGVLGAGRLGSALAEALARGGYRVGAVASRSRAPAEALARKLAAFGETRLVACEDLPAHADAVFLSVPDDTIATVAALLPWREGQAAIHCAGALGLDALASARARGALAGCLHPLQSFPERTGGADRFRGIACGVEGDGGLGPELERLSAKLGAKSFSLAGVDRARYHAAAVFASNYVVALHAAAERAWALAGLPPERAREALAPLTRGAAANIVRLPLPEALTGPVARGDAATVERHLAALADAPDLADLYRRLGAALLDLDLPLAPADRNTLAAAFARSVPRT